MSFKSDPELGLSLIDRFTYQTLAFFENMDISSNEKLSDLFKTYRWVGGGRLWCVPSIWARRAGSAPVHGVVAPRHHHDRSEEGLQCIACNGSGPLLGIWVGWQAAAASRVRCLNHAFRCACSYDLMESHFSYRMTNTSRKPENVQLTDFFGAVADVRTGSQRGPQVRAWQPCVGKGLGLWRGGWWCGLKMQPHVLLGPEDAKTSRSGQASYAVYERKGGC